MRFRVVLWWVLLLLWCGVIFWGTGDPHFTGESTRAVVQHAAPGIGGGSPTELDWVNVALRKATHIVLFAVVGMLARRAIGTWPGAAWRPRLVAGWGWLFATLYAASDEWHQHFVPGRTASGWDVLLDSAAAAVILLVVPWLAQCLGQRKAAPSA